MRKSVILALAILVVGTITEQSGAQGRSGAAFSTIVVFHENASMDQFAPGYQADDRAAADPSAWGYLNRGVAGYVQSLERGHGFRAENVYSASIRGFSARLNARQIQAMENDPAVAYVEPDGIMSIDAQTIPWGIAKVGGGRAVTNVRAYIIDTGIDTDHADLNVAGHVNFAGGPNKDCHGHGTHVAGTVAAKDNSQDVIGVASGAPLYGVKVLGCGGSGSTAGVIKGVDWVTAQTVKPAVANMSLGGSVSTALDNAVKNSASSGVFYALAAGNSGALACNSSPARAGTSNGVMTVAATDSADNEASWSNYGSCVDIWAPGVSILSTRKGGGTTTMSGTSMASPHGAGGAALYLSNNTGASPAIVEAALKGAADSTGKTSKDGTAIKRLFVGTF